MNENDSDELRLADISDLREIFERSRGTEAADVKLANLIEQSARRYRSHVEDVNRASDREIARALRP